MSVALIKSRFTNALKCYGSYALDRLGSALPFIHRTLYTIHHLPTFVSVEPASICQLHCPACPVGLRYHKSQITTHQSQIMPLEVWHRTLQQVASTAHTIQFYFQGEPLLHPDLPQMIREAHDAGLYTIVSTNAQALTPELAEALVASGLDRIIISMDGLTDTSYNAYRVGGSLDKTKAAIRYLREAKLSLPLNRSVFCQRSGLTIELQCLRLRTNEHEWREFKRVYKSLGADRLVFKTAQLYDYAHGHPLMPSDPRYSRYTMGSDGLYHRKRLHRGCLRVWSGVVITTNGEVLPCCYDKAHTYAYGNIMTAPLAELFTNDRAKAFRKAAMQETPQICQECWR